MAALLVSYFDRGLMFKSLHTSGNHPHNQASFSSTPFSSSHHAKWEVVLVRWRKLIENLLFLYHEDGFSSLKISFLYNLG